MNKKLTTIILAVLLLLIGKVDAATLTQKVGGTYIHQTISEGQIVRLKFINQTNHIFASWTVESGNVDIDTTNPVITFTMPNEDVIIKANYAEAAASSYTITYNANGGTGSMTAQTVTEGESIALTTNTFTYDGYTFKGWSEDSSATTATYTDGQSITPTANMTLYAIWEEVYTLTYDANGGSGAPALQTGTSLTISSTTPEKDKWTFMGWGTSSSATDATYQAGDSITLTADTTLYAVWKGVLTYDANGGSGAPADEVHNTLGSAFYLSSVIPTRSGYAFRGWATSSSATVADYRPKAYHVLDTSKTLYAVWVTPLESGSLLTNIDVGAYITYEAPEITAEEVADSINGQIYTPSTDDVSTWRIFSNNGTNIEIISNNGVGSLELTGETGYINAVQILQTLSNKYVNSTYATSGRSLGYYDETRYISTTNSGSAMTETELANYKTINTQTYPIEYGIDATSFPYFDTQYKPDSTIMENNKSLNFAPASSSTRVIWFASRCGSQNSFSGTPKTSFSVRSLLYTCKGQINNLYYIYSDGTVESMSWTAKICPVITLKSGLKISGGDGSPSNPYTLSY